MRVQFRLRGLFAAIVVAACVSFGVLWHIRTNAVQKCLHDYESLSSKYDAGLLADAVAVANASIALMHAEAAVPFSNGRRAAAAHVARITSLDTRATDRFHRAMFDSDQALKEAGEQAAAVHKLRIEAEEHTQRTPE